MSAPAAAPEVRVLVVEDEPTFREVLVAALGAEGLHARVAASAEEARAALAAEAPDVVLADYGLPGATGLHLLAEAAAHGAAGILLTGYTDREEVAAARRAGRFVVLAKPVALARLVAWVRNAAARAAYARACRAAGEPGA